MKLWNTGTQIVASFLGVFSLIGVAVLISKSGLAGEHMIDQGIGYILGAFAFCFGMWVVLRRVSNLFGNAGFVAECYKSFMEGLRGKR